MYWKFLPSAGIPEDQPQLSCGSRWSYLRRVIADCRRLTGCIYKTNPLEHGVSESAGTTVSDRGLHLNWHLLLTSAMLFRCLPTSHLVQCCKGVSLKHLRILLQSPSVFFQRANIRKNKQENKCYFCCGCGFHSTTGKKKKKKRHNEWFQQKISQCNFVLI